MLRLGMERKGSAGIAGILILAAFILLQWDGLAGKPAPNFTLDHAYGGRVDLSTYRGRPVLLAFWLSAGGEYSGRGWRARVHG